MLAATQTTLYIQYNKDHAYAHGRTQKGQRSQTVSTALSVAIITRQPYIMKAISVAAPIYDIWNMGGGKIEHSIYNHTIFDGYFYIHLSKFAAKLQQKIGICK